MFSRRYEVRALWFAVLAGIATSFLLSPITSLGQRPEAKSETITGRVAEVQKKGRGTTLVVETDAGEKREFPLTPKVQFVISAQGDAGFVVPGQYLAGKGVLTNGKVFLNSLTIQLVRKGQRPPPGKMVKAPAKTGESQNAYLVSGPIVSRETDKDYPDYQVLALKTAGPGAPIMLEKGFQVTVETSDTALVPAGAPIELEGTPLPRDGFNLVKATIRLAEPLDSATIMAAGDGKK
jgi:hypothetical protein